MSPGTPASPDPAIAQRLNKLEADLQRAERHHQADEKREHPLGEHDDFGPTLGGDLMKPNPGKDLPPGDDED